MMTGSAFPYCDLRHAGKQCRFGPTAEWSIRSHGHAPNPLWFPAFWGPVRTWRAFAARAL